MTTTDTRCIDCGEPTTPAIDGPLCPECARIAVALLGSTQRRIDMLQERS